MKALKDFFHKIYLAMLFLGRKKNQLDVFLLRRKVRFFIRFFHFKRLDRLFLLIFLIFSLFFSVFIGYFIYKIDNLEDIKDLKNYSLYELPTVVYDVKGRKITEFYLIKRKIINFKEIPDSMIQTLLAAEDKNFFDHSGVDLLGILRAFIRNIKEGTVKQGGSTISQQLAKLLFTTRERTIARKLKELWLTFQIEKEYTKEEILEKYLNKVYYGNNLYGIAAASDFYFGKEVKDLNYAEAAFLVAIPPAPTYLNPLKNPTRTKERQTIILQKLVKDHILSASEAEKQLREFWLNFQQRLVNGDFYRKKEEDRDLAPYFSEYIRRLMIEKFSDKIYTGGYRIYTTLDLDKQNLAHKLLREALKKQNEEYTKNMKEHYIQIAKNYPKIIEFLSYPFFIPEMEFYKGELDKNVFQHLVEKELFGINLAISSFYKTGENLLLEENILAGSDDFVLDYATEGAFVTLEIPSGRIVTMVGGSDYTPFNQINRVYQMRRQPGSAFKPFIYLAAFLSKIFTPASVINDIPLIFKMEDEIWTPGNADRRYEGRIRLRDALKKSLNVVSVRIVENIKPSQVIDVATKIFGLPIERFREDFSVALGTSELTPLEMAKGYAVLGNMGKDITPYAIIKVENRYGKVIWSPEEEILAKQHEQIIPKEYAYLVLDLMKDVIGPGGTASGARISTNFTYPAAGKTGTTSNFRDVWFAGVSTTLSSVIWMGFDRGISMGYWAYASQLAAPVWMNFMKEAMKDYPITDWQYPGGLYRVKVCAKSGLLPGDSCKETIEEWFIPDTEPKKTCDLCEQEEKEIEKDLEKIKLMGGGKNK